MPDLRWDALKYFARSAESFWDWDTAAEALVWVVNGRTITFRTELEHVLRILARGGYGLPPLGLVLLVLAACRDSWEEAVGAGDSLDLFVGGLELAAPDGARLEHGLTKISRLCPELRHPIEAKAHLLQFLFETGGAYRTGEEALAVCDKLLLGQASLSKRYRPAWDSRQDLRNGVAHLIHGLERLDEQTLKLRAITGLDELVRPAEIESEAWKQSRVLISSLLDDQEYGGLARLARALMAVVHLPRPLWEPEDLPMGGFSDIENRGSLDRLLVSELAHDDLTLAVRIALNEALYLRRETPPKTPALARSILVDVGIRMWGIPRLFATSASLALMATTDHHAAATVYRAKGAWIEKADMTTREGLIEHLGCLETDVHPGRALAPLLATLKQRVTRTDCIVITSEEAAADPEFQRCVARQDIDSLYLATVNRSGDFRLVYHGSHSRKLICEAKLSLDDLLVRRGRRSVPLIDAEKGKRLPAIFYENPSPLVIPCNIFNRCRSWTVPGYGVLEIARDQRLLLWNSSGRGPQQIVDRVPGKAPICWGDNRVRSNQWIAVLDQPGDQYQLLTVDVANRSATLTHLESTCSSPTSPHSFWAEENWLFAIASDCVIVFSRSGRVVNRIPTDRETAIESYRLRHQFGRFFVEETSRVWYALSLNSMTANHNWQKVFGGRHQEGFELVAMIDWSGREGPIGITRQGEVYFPEERRRVRLNDRIQGPIDVLDVSPCGEYVLIEQPETPMRNRCFVSLATGQLHSVSSSLSARQLATLKWVHPSNDRLHRHFAAVARTSGGQLALVSTKGLVWLIELCRHEIRLQPNVMHVTNLGAKVKAFSQHVNAAAFAFHLNVATFQDGSRIYLDSRGLLHLRSSDQKIPETTLVLADRALAGWCADGRTWGNAYYVGTRPNSDARDVYEEVIRPFVGRLTS